MLLTFVSSKDGIIKVSNIPILGGGIYCIIYLDPIWIGIGIVALAALLIMVILLVSRRIVLG
ncbi:unnamed protein product, partial [marine sediment metagenome]